MGHFLKVNLKKEKRMVEVFLDGLMDHTMMEIF